ncbi:MAG: UDP-N-acetylmuramoyl-L-alanyl-D-glutamate--2,6-diaminopimelate ligase [bacterium]|nr:UDP-N-acetylmuramoyl-L-alanyl-D-glutamate--2,6-diaminopimelate ligase [bacterium]
MSARGVTAGILAESVGGEAKLIGASLPVSDLFHDSRDVIPGSGFVAVRGSIVDGHDHVPSACAAGASLVVVDHEMDSGCPELVVDDTRGRMAELASVVHGRPAEELQMVGVTGTNGKTTVTHMLEAIANAANLTPGILGTVGAHIAGELVPMVRTTPESTDLHRLLRRMVDRGVDFAALEVSSHALILGRADSIVFDVAAFTNLSQDHLDFHHTMDAYFAAKAQLFTAARTRHAVVWVDDPAGKRLVELAEVPTTRVGFGPAGSQDASGEVTGWGISHTDVTVHLPETTFSLRLPLAGRFNAANALVAAAVAHRLDIATQAIVDGLENLPAIPGRFEAVPNDRGLAIIVDYAHTPEAVELSIATAREATTGRVLAVVGSAGDRDPGKRVPMGRAAATAHVAIITSDNPRSEDPALLVEQVLVGAGGRGDSVIGEVDRRIAIRRAIEFAEVGDIVLILGKGHEPYQEFADRTIDFDDRLVASQELAVLGGGST